MGFEHVKFFLGGDTAPSDSQRSDDGALVIGTARPRYAIKPEEPLPDNEGDWIFDFVYGRVYTAKEKLSARQWSAIIHGHHKAFGFEKIVLDAGAGGGGIFVKRELMAKTQLINGVETDTMPIADQVDGPLRLARAHFILHMFKRGDPGVDRVWPDPSNAGKSLAGDELLKDGLFSSFKEAVDRVGMGWPLDVDEVLVRKQMAARVGGTSNIQHPTSRDSNNPDEWLLRQPEEWWWALKVLQAGRSQLCDIMVATTEDKDGNQRFVFTKRGARMFTSGGKDDIALAMMYCYAAFRVWLMSEDLHQGVDDEDAAGFSGSSA